MAQNEKKGKGLFGKIADAISGNKDEQPGENQSSPAPDSNGQTDDVAPDNKEVQELKEDVPPVPKPKSSGPKQSFSDMLRARAESRKPGFKK